MAIEKISRNKEIFKKHLKGMNYQSLAVEYGLSYAMVAIICQRYKRKKELKSI